jgi:hypothetical protein
MKRHRLLGQHAQPNHGWRVVVLSALKAYLPSDDNGLGIEEFSTVNAHAAYHAII